LLQVEGLTKAFGEVVANDGISLDVRRGEIHCLLGENGAGKSTLAECLYGFYRPDAGQILFRGQPVRLASPSDAIRLGIGMVHQHFALVAPLTVIENVIVGTPGAALVPDLKQIEEFLRGICDGYGFRLDLRARIWQLSVGEQQWVEILKALYVGSELLILDEPTAVLTPLETEKFFATLREMTARGLSILLITHKLEEVKAVSDRVTVLRRGRYVATVNTADVSKADLARMMVGREVVFSVQREGSPGEEPVLEVRNLHALGDRGQEALRGVSLTLRRGEILGLAAVSGNGQKELFEVIAGVRKATAGAVVLEGEEITNRSAGYVMSRGVGHVPEDRLREGLVPDFTVEENLLLGQQRSKLYSRGPFLNFPQIRKFARMCVSTFEIKTPSLQQPTKHLSGGNVQKIILARELTHCPQALLANQPTRGLDVGVVEYVHGRLLEKRAEGVGILLSSEDLDEILDLSDRIAVLFKGQVMGIFDARAATVEQIGLLMAGVTIDDCGLLIAD
jgi:general nucleoside transport system ATP-binding protein